MGKRINVDLVGAGTTKAGSMNNDISPDNERIAGYSGRSRLFFPKVPRHVSGAFSSARK